MTAVVTWSATGLRMALPLPPATVLLLIIEPAVVEGAAPGPTPTSSTDAAAMLPLPQP
jgi:hypothetical protein